MEQFSRKRRPFQAIRRFNDCLCRTSSFYVNWNYVSTHRRLQPLMLLMSLMYLPCCINVFHCTSLSVRGERVGCNMKGNCIDLAANFVYADVATCIHWASFSEFTFDGQLVDGNGFSVRVLCRYKGEGKGCWRSARLRFILLFARWRSMSRRTLLACVVYSFYTSILCTF